MMTRTAFPLQVDDLSAFARSLQRQLDENTGTVSHLTLMNMLTRAAGFRNFQHFRAMAEAGNARSAPAATPDMGRVGQALRYFDPAGRLTSWPAKTSVQHLVMWALWAKLPGESAMSEREVSTALNEWHLFGDAAILRRTLWELKLVTRSQDGREYRRMGREPPPEGRALIRALAQQGRPAA
jgi:hypothetical protein